MQNYIKKITSQASLDRYPTISADVATYTIYAESTISGERETLNLTVLTDKNGSDVVYTVFGRTQTATQLMTIDCQLQSKMVDISVEPNLGDELVVRFTKSIVTPLRI